MNYKLHNHKKRYVSMDALNFLRNNSSEPHGFFMKYAIFTLQFISFRALLINLYRFLQLKVVCFFIPHLLYIQSTNRPGKFFPCTFSSLLNIFAFVDIKPPNNTLFFKLMFSNSFIDFEKVFKESDIASNVNRSS